MKPKLGIKRTGEKSTLSLAMQMEIGEMDNTLNNALSSPSNFLYWLPSLWYEYQFQTGRRLMLFYNTDVNVPGVTQLLPVVNNINPLSVYHGNPDLKPEISHQFNAHYILFDQFSFTSLVANVSGTYVKDKINSVRTVDNNLIMINTLDNFDKEVIVNGNIDFSTPLRRLDVKIHLNLDESWNKGLNLINRVENEYTNLGHRFSFSIDNRKKEKWDVNTGVEVTLTNSRIRFRAI